MKAVPMGGRDLVLEGHARLVEGGALPAALDAEAILAHSDSAQRPRPSAASFERWAKMLEPLDLPEAARASFRALRDEGASVVITGQQAGVLTGPYLCLLKAAHAVRLARELEKLSGRRVVPVFWVASDDHDQAEVKSVHVVNRDRQVQRLSLPLDLPSGGRAAVSEVPVPAEAVAFVNQVLATADTKGQSAEWMEPRAGERISEWFARLMVRLLGEEGLIPIEPSVLLEDGRALFEKVLAQPDSWSRSFDSGTAAVQAAECSAPLEAPGGLPLFLIDGERRTRLHSDGQAWFESQPAVAHNELPALLLPGPRRLSPDAALRPVFQNAVLPVLAYIAGPTEMLYWAQLRPAHEWLEIPFPAVVPRLEARLLPRRITRVLRKLGWSLEEALARLQQPSTSEAMPAALQRGEAVGAEIDRWLAEIGALHPSVQHSIRRSGEQLRRSFEQSLERARQSWTDRHRHSAEGLDWLLAYLEPKGQAPDRLLNGLPFLAEQGSGVLRQLLELDPQVRRWTVLLES